MTDPTAPDIATLTPALDHLECLPLGDAVILHNRESGAIVASNAFGALLIDALRAVPDIDALVARIAAELALPVPKARAAVEATLSRWTEDGLFLTDLQPFPMPIAHRPPVEAARRFLSLGSRAAVVHSESADLADDIARALAPMGLAAESSEKGVQLEVIEEDGVFGVFRDGAPVWGAAPYELTRFHLLREIMDILCGPDRVAAHLHASAVAIDGTALVFAGASGSGKSTLATALIGTGAVLVADDHVAVDVSGEALRAFPTRPNLKPGAREIPAVAVATGGEGAGEFTPETSLPVGAAVRLAGFVFPRFDPDGDNAVTRLDPAEALRALIQTGSRVSRSTKSIAPLLYALNTHPVRELSYRDTDFAIGECRALLGQ